MKVNHLNQNVTLSKWQGLITNSFFFAVCLTGIIFLQNSQANQQQENLSSQKYQEQEKNEAFELSLTQNIPALGFDNILANWLYLRFIQYFGDSDARESIGFNLSSEYFKQVVQRDPRFVDAFVRLDSATSVFEGNPKVSVSSLDHALKYISPTMIAPGTKPYYLWFYKAIDQLLFLGDPQGAKHSYQMAINWAKETGDVHSPQLITRIQEMIKFLDKNPKSKVAQIGAWAAVLANSMDEKSVKRVVKEIRALGGEVIQTPDGRLLVRVPPNVD